MAFTTRTVTGATSYTDLRMDHHGVTAIRNTFTSEAATQSASDTYQMLPVIHRMTILDGYVTGTAPVSGAVVIRVETDDYVFGTVSLSATSATTRFNKGIPAVISLSDTEAYDTIDCVVVSSSTATVTCSFDLVVWYAVPGLIT